VHKAGAGPVRRSSVALAGKNNGFDYRRSKEGGTMIARALGVLLVASCIAIAVRADGPVRQPAEDTNAAGLDSLRGIEIPVVMKFQSTDVGKLFEALGAAAGFEVSVDDAVRARMVSVDMGKVDLKTALVRLADEYHLAYDVRSSKELHVSDDVRKPKAAS